MIVDESQEEVKNLRIPQFVYGEKPTWVFLPQDYELLEEDHLSEGFSLSGQDAQIDFSLSTGEMYTVDIQDEGEAVPKYKRASQNDSEYFQKYLERFPAEDRIERCTDLIAGQINRNNRYSTQDVKDYVKRVVANMTEEELAVIETSIPSYARKIQEKISKLENEYRAKQFKKWIDSGKVKCEESYSIPKVITPAETIDSIPDSLYEAEKDDMNNFERKVIDTVVGMNNIRWWHRIIERKDFCLNGWFRHYPDFMVMTKSGKLLLIEAKGDYLDGDDSKAKLELGRKWQEQAGRMYRYFMVFNKKELGMDGAYTLDEFANLMKDL